MKRFMFCGVLISFRADDSIIFISIMTVTAEEMNTGISFKSLKKSSSLYVSEESASSLGRVSRSEYGCAVFVRDDGALLYCEQQADLTVIGDTLQEEDLHSFDELPDGEQQLIIHALLKDPETPDFSKQILYRKGDRQYD